MWISNRIVKWSHFGYTSPSLPEQVRFRDKMFDWLSNICSDFRNWYAPCGGHVQAIFDQCNIIMSKHFCMILIPELLWYFDTMCYPFLWRYCVRCRYKYRGEKFYQSSYPWNWTGSKLSAFLPTHLLSFLSYKALKKAPKKSPIKNGTMYRFDTVASWSFWCRFLELYNCS